MPAIYKIPGPWPGHIAISSRPRGGDWLGDDVANWRQAGIDVVVSLLESNEETDLDLADEQRLASLHGIRFVSFAIPDRGVPSKLSEFGNLLGDLRRELESGKTVAIHCRQGIGRSALVAAGVLLSSGMDPAEALKTVAEARGLPVPETRHQRNWLEGALSDYLSAART